jgi:hypothetical protein
VLCSAPDYRALKLGAQHARGGVLDAVEWPSDRLIGWAMATQAINLRTGTTAAVYDRATRERLEFVGFIGNNG